MEKKIKEVNGGFIAKMFDNEGSSVAVSPVFPTRDEAEAFDFVAPDAVEPEQETTEEATATEDTMTEENVPEVAQVEESPEA